MLRGCSLSALLMLRDALHEAAEQRCSLLDASARAEQLWGAASASGFEAAGRAQPDQTGSCAVVDEEPPAVRLSSFEDCLTIHPLKQTSTRAVLRPSAGQQAGAERRQLIDSLADAVSTDSASLGSAFQQADGLRSWQPQQARQQMRQQQHHHLLRPPQTPQHQHPGQLSTFSSHGTAKQLFASSGAVGGYDSEGDLHDEFGPQASSELSSFAMPPRRMLRTVQQACSCRMLHAIP